MKEDSIKRRSFLRTAGAATVAGVGLVTASSTASANSPYPLDMQWFDEFTYGDPNSDRAARFRFMVPEPYWTGELASSWFNANTYRGDEMEHAENAISDLYYSTNQLEGITVQMYTYDSAWFDDYGSGEARYTPTLDILDDALNSTGAGDSTTHVWDLGEVQQQYTSDWDDSTPGNFDGPYTDPTQSSDDWHPILATNGTASGDEHGHDFPHVRVRVGSFSNGRLTSYLIHSLIRCRDDGYWSTWQSPPGTTLYDPNGEDWTLAYGVDTGQNTGFPSYNDVYTVSAAGRITPGPMEDTFNSGICTGDTPSGDWQGPGHTEGQADHVSSCTSYMVGQAIDYFD